MMVLFNVDQKLKCCISILEDVITDAIAEEESTISISEKEDMSTGLFLLEQISLFAVR
jgi:hypothetical protein